MTAENTFKLSLDKKYRTAQGHKVRLLCLDFNNRDGPNVTQVLGLVTDPRSGKEMITVWSTGGQTGNKEYNLIEITPWEEFEDGERVLFRYSPEVDWSRGYFAGIRDGRPAVYAKGSTKWASFGLVWVVGECIRPDPDDLPVNV